MVLVLQFHLKAFEFVTTFFSFCGQQILYLLLYKAYILTIPKKQQQKANRYKSQKKLAFWMKTRACRDGTLKNQQDKMAMTPHYFHTIPTSCAVLLTMHTTKLSTCISYCSHQLLRWMYNYTPQGTQHCSLHSLLYIRQPISPVPSLPHLRCSVAIMLQPPTTQLTLHACQHALHTQHYLPHYLPQPSYAHNKHRTQLARWHKM